MHPPFPCYDGDEPYIFVSYAHADAELVYPQLSRLREMGFNVWFDEGISPGSSWRAELAQAIADCGMFVYFVTPRSVASEICIKEVSYAQTRGKPILVIHLEETELPIHLEFTLGDIQAIMQYGLTEADYAHKLSRALERKAPEIEEPVAMVTHRDSWKPLAIGIAAVVVVALSGFAAWQFLTPQTGQQHAVENTVAETADRIVMVLPFDNLSSSEEDRYFTMGIYDDVLVKVSRLPELKVTGRATAMRFRNSERSLADIAEEVGASHILTGSVRHLGDNVRISAELISMRDQTQLWAEIFERPVADAFDVQQDIANGVAGVLGIDAVSAEAEPNKANLEAYNLFAEAREIINASNPGDIGHALGLLRQVIELDPAFADAYSYMVIGLFRGVMLAQYHTDARRAAEHALALDPDSHDSHFAMALTSSGEEARTHFEKALELNPNDSRIRLQYGNILVNQGRLDAGWQQWNQAIQLDPLSAATHLSMVNALPSMGRWKEAMSHLDRALELEPDNPQVLWEAAGAMDRNERHLEALRLYVKLYELNPGSVQVIARVAQRLIGLRHYDAAEAWLARLPEQGTPWAYGLKAGLLRGQGDIEGSYAVAREWLASYPDDGSAKVNLAFAIAQIAREAYHAERYVESEQQRLRAVEILEEVLAPELENDHYRWREPNQWPLSALMVLLASLGEHDRATAIAEDILPYSGVSYDWAGAQFHRGIAYAILGQVDESVAAFQTLVDEPFLFLSADSFEAFGLTGADTFGLFQSLRNNVGFQDAVRGIRAREERTVQQLKAEFPNYF